MWIVAGGAVSLGPGVLDLRLLDLSRLLAVAAHADQLHVGLHQNDLTVLRGLMAGITLAAGKRRMRLRLHQLGRP